MNGSGLTLQQLADDINARLKKGDDYFVSASQHLLEAKDRVEAGEWDGPWEIWCDLHITRWREVKKRLTKDEAKKLIAHEVKKQAGATSAACGESSPRSHRSTGKKSSGRPEGAISKAAKALGASRDTVERAFKEPSDWRDKIIKVWDKGTPEDKAWFRGYVKDEASASDGEAA